MAKKSKQGANSYTPVPRQSVEINLPRATTQNALTNVPHIQAQCQRREAKVDGG